MPALRFMAIMALVGLGASSAHADLFSPGPLAKPHAEFEGLSKCSLCHAQGGDEDHFQEKCLACHTELAPRVSKGLGFHGRLSDEKRDCKLCHHDHQGVDFKMVEWAPSRPAFPHGETGWALKGGHAKLKCEDCHQLKRIQAADIRRWLDKHAGAETYLGLPTKCTACHFDEHRQQLGDQCEQCHGEKGWTPAPGFDHAKSDYPLTGKHKQVACVKCHELKPDAATPANAFPAPVKKQFATYTELAFESCQDCHQDPHKGTFGDSCTKCHVTEGWRVIHSNESERAFHDKTRFPLKGKHADVDCKSCHGPFKGHAAKFKGLAFQSCSDCHVDAHEGQLTATGLPKSDCDACHTVAGFKPARFEVAEHQKTHYPLEGAHGAVPCSACHVSKPGLAARIPPAAALKLKNERRPSLFSETLFQFTAPPARCETCHADPHAGQFHSAGDTRACSTCHKVASFTDVAFNHDKDSRFPLTGAHAKATCAQCHTPTSINGVTTTRYRPVDMACASCHADVHAGQFRKKDAPAQVEACTDCHDTQAFKPAGRFVHAPPFTTYLLDGEHAKVKCEACHPATAVAPGVEVRKYVGLPTRCSGCHQDFHHGEFRKFSP